MNYKKTTWSKFSFSEESFLQPLFKKNFYIINSFTNRVAYVKYLYVSNITWWWLCVVLSRRNGACPHKDPTRCRKSTSIMDEHHYITIDNPMDISLAEAITVLWENWTDFLTFTIAFVVDVNVFKGAKLFVISLWF